MFSKTALTSSNLNRDTAFSLALASQLAYQPATTIIDVVTRKWRFKHCEPLSSDSTAGYVAIAGSLAMVVFSGLDQRPQAWLSRLGETTEQRPYGAVLRDVWTGFDRLRAATISALDSVDTASGQLWLTGHGFGGALAGLAMAELPTVRLHARCCTFGAPRFSSKTAALHLSAECQNRYTGLINDNDIVARVLPGLSHVGRSWQVDQLASAQNTSNGSDDAEMDRHVRKYPALSEHEYQQLHKALVNGTSSVAGNYLPALERLDVSTMDDLLSGFENHLIQRYVASLQPQRVHHSSSSSTCLLDRTFTGEATKPDPQTRGVVRVGSEVREPNEDLVPVVFRVRHSDWRAPDGLHVNSRLGTIITAKVSASTIDRLTADPDVITVDVSRDAGQPECAVSVPFIGASAFHNAPLRERGDSSLVAIIDSGVDVLHQSFLDANGNSRIRAVWDQTTNTPGQSPADRNSALYTGLDHGTLYEAHDIASMLQIPDEAPVKLRDVLGHGTHVASIAAGRSVGNFSGGVAPDAAIIVVIPHTSTSPGDPPSLGYSTSHVDALSFLRIFAETSGLPIVVNLSLGMNAGAHDGSSTLEAGFDAFSGSGRDAGFVIVKSAGNERGHGGHAEVQVRNGALSTIEWNSKTTKRSSDYIEAWFGSSNTFEFTLLDPAQRSSPVVSDSNPEAIFELGGNECRMSVTEFHPDNGDSRLVLQIKQGATRIQDGRWVLRILGDTVIDGGQVHAWVERDNARAVSFLTGNNDQMTLTIPGTAHSVITVGACHAGMPLVLNQDSSFGPTRDGRNKPDLCAPGFNIIAARANSANNVDVATRSGTSMAAPHVTGAIALKMSSLHKDTSKPQLNARQLRAMLTRQTRPGPHHPGFGFGVLTMMNLEP